MHHLIDEMIPVETTEARPDRFHAQLGRGPSRGAPPTGTERIQACELRSAVERTLTQAKAVLDSSVHLNGTLGLAIDSGQDCSSYILPREETRILSPRACTRKRIEFKSGRAAAHLALNQIGFVRPFPVLRGTKGEPLWPEGITGSITHCFPWSVAATLRYPKRVAIGVDLETTEAVGPTDISELVCTNAELDWVRSGRSQERLTMIFSAKEAVYKAFHPLCRRYIDFKEVELTWVPEQACFQGQFLAPFGPGFPRGEEFAAHCCFHAQLVFSCVIHCTQ